MIEELTCDPSASYSPSVTLYVASNPTLIARLVPASINTKHQKDCNIHMPTYINHSNRLDVKHIYHSRINCMRNRNINRYIWENEKQTLLKSRKGRLQPMIDLMSPTVASSQPHHNQHLTSSVPLLSLSQLRIQQHFFTKILPSLALGSVLNL